MSLIKGKNTKPEILLRSMLHQSGFRFRIHDKKLPGTPDIVLPRYHTVIFVNGCFWHRHPGCKKAYTPKSQESFWTKKFEATISRDKEKRNHLEQSGWSVMTVWECDLQKDSSGILGKVIQKLKHEANL